MVHYVGEWGGCAPTGALEWKYWDYISIMLSLIIKPLEPGVCVKCGIVEELETISFSWLFSCFYASVTAANVQSSNKLRVRLTLG